MIMESLSCVEREIANEFCKGFSDKEVADNLDKSYWTVKTQKKAIYKKLGISKDTELILYMVCEKVRIERNTQAWFRIIVLCPISGYAGHLQ